MPYNRDKSPGANQMVMTIQLRADDRWWVQLYEQFVDVEIPTKPKPPIKSFRFSISMPSATQIKSPLASIAHWSPSL